jgi:hypothetical protein
MKYGLIVLCYFGFWAQANAQSADPIKVTVNENANGSINVAIQNTSTAMLTAFALSTGAPHCMIGDSVIDGWVGIKPGQGGSLAFLARYVNAELKAAIFADGRTFGDEAVIHEILMRRRATLDVLGIIFQQLPAAGTPPMPLIPFFDSHRDRQLKDLRNDDPAWFAIMNAYTIVERQIQEMAGELPDSIIAKVATMLLSWQTDLNNSLPSLAAIR